MLVITSQEAVNVRGKNKQIPRRVDKLNSFQVNKLWHRVTYLNNNNNASISDLIALVCGKKREGGGGGGGVDLSANGP